MLVIDTMHSNWMGYRDTESPRASDERSGCNVKWFIAYEPKQRFESWIIS